MDRDSLVFLAKLAEQAERYVPFVQQSEREESEGDCVRSNDGIFLGLLRPTATMRWWTT